MSYAEAPSTTCGDARTLMCFHDVHDHRVIVIAVVQMIMLCALDAALRHHVSQ